MKVNIKYHFQQKHMKYFSCDTQSSIMNL